MPNVSFQPSTVMLVPSAACPAECRYCFGPHEGGSMSASVLDASARFIRDELWRDRRAGKIIFHGGEPLMAGHEWFERSLGILAEATGYHAQFTLQSNLWALDQRFVDLFAEYRVSIGTSLDGDRDICDAQRGAGYFDKTMAGIRLLRENGIKVSAIATILPENVDRVPEMIAFFDQEGLPFTMRGAEPSLEGGYRNCLSASDTERLYRGVLEYMECNPAPSRVRDVEAAVRNVFSQSSTLCTFSNCLGRYAAIGPEGGVYTCQRFCGVQEFCIGTVFDRADALQHSAAYKRIAAVYESAARTCDPCAHFHYCNGGCPYNILVAEKYGRPWPRCNDSEPSGRVYKGLFDHIRQKIAAEAADVMLGRGKPTPYLAAAGDRPHPGDALQGRIRYAQAYDWGVAGAPRHAFAQKHGAECLFLNITSNCPLRCAHCSVEASGGNPEMPVDTALTIIREAQALGFREVSINGGEPFFYREFPALLRGMAAIRDKNTAFSLFTSLYLDFNDDLAGLVLRTFDQISVSLDGGVVEHDLRRSEGAFARTTEHLGKLAELNRQQSSPCKLMVRAALTREQRDRGVDKEVREAANALGISFVTITSVLPIGRAKQLEAPVLPAPTPPKDDFFASFVPRDSCGLCSSPHITPQGDIYPCWAYLEEGNPLGNVRDGLRNVIFDYVWGNRKYEYCVDNSEKCQACDVRYLCGGVCRAYRNSDCEALRTHYLSLLEADRMG